MSSPIVTAYMDVVPTVRGMKGTIARQMNPIADTEGKAAGKRTGRSMAAGLAMTGGIIAGAIAGLGIADQFSKAIQGAGDLEQSIGAIDTVFKDNAGQMHAWANTAAQTVGLSKNQYNEFGTLIGSQLKNAGIPMSEVAGQTNELITLGSDLSSMFGGSTSEAVEALSSALKGERDPIERYGVTLTQASIESKAMEMGLISASGEMDKQAETAATLALVMDQTKDAQGNFGKESGTFQGQLQRLTAQWADFRTNLGMKLLPVFSAVVDFLNNRALPAIERIGPALAAATAWVRNFVGSADVSDGGIAGFIARVRDLAIAFGQWVVTTGVPALRSMWAVVGPLLGEAFRALGTVLGFLVTQFARFGSFLIDHRGTLTNIAIVVGSMVAAWKIYQITMVAVALVTRGFQLAMLALRTAMLWVQGTIWLVRNATLLLNLAFAANPIGIVVIAIVGLVTALVVAYNRIGWFKDGVAAAWGWIKAAAANTVNWFTTVAWPALQAALRWIGSAFTWLWQFAVIPAFNGIRFVANIAVTVLKIILGGLYLFIKNVVAPVFLWLWRNAVKPALDAIRTATVVMWQAFLKPTFAALRVGLQWVAQKFTDTKNWALAAWRGLRVGLQIGYAWIRAHVFVPLRAGLQWVAQKFTDVKNWALRAWGLLRLQLVLLWLRIRAHVFVPLRAGLQWVGQKFADVKAWVVRIWDGMRFALFNGWQRIKQYTFDPLKRGVSAVKDAFKEAKDGVVIAWGALREAVKKPVAFVVNKVINPFIGGYNEMNNFWSGENLDPIKGFAGGGILPGYQPRKIDDILMPMRRGEGVMVPEFVRGGGDAFLHAGNRIANSGGVSAVKKWIAGLGEGLAKGGVVRPLRGGTVSSGYGNRAGGFHDGIDIAAPTGTPIYAAKDGRVRRSHFSAYGGGNEVQVVHDGGLVSWYAHMSKRLAAAGQVVKAGQKIGEVGSTGLSSGPHLHFAVFQGDWPNHRDPNKFLGGMLKGDGTGGGGSWTDPIQWIKDKITSKFDYKAALSTFKDNFTGNKFGQMGLGLGQKAIDGVIEKAASIADPIINAVDAVKDYSSKQVAKAANRTKVEAWALEALKATNQLGWRRQRATVDQAFIESGGDPNAVNNWDINAKRGDPSKGIMQVIGETFRSYAMPGKNNILDPVHNMIAAIRYVMARYGGIENIWPTKAGYALGGVVGEAESLLSRGPTVYDGGGNIYRENGRMQLIAHRERRPDRVLTDGQWSDIHSLAMRRPEPSGATENHYHMPFAPEDPSRFGRRVQEAQAWEYRKARR